jgi:hypothetical protein
MAASAGFGAMTSAAGVGRAIGDISVPFAGATAEVRGAHPSVSDDGRWVVFDGTSSDGSGRAGTVWLRDRTRPDAPDIELTTPAVGVRPGASVRPAISGDACSVAVNTEMAYDLFRDDDTGSRWDVYRLVLPQCGGTPGDWELVSTRSSNDGDTSALDRVIPDRAPSVSQVGTLVAFTYQARTRGDLLAARVVDLTVPLGDPTRSTDVAGTPLLGPNTTFRYLGQRQPDVSDDGRFVAFTSDADSAAATPEWGTGPVAGEYATSQVFLWDRLADAGDAALETPVVLVSQADGVAAAQGASSPVVSGNGQYVAYTSASADLADDADLPGDCTITCPTQVYRYDIIAGSSVLVSRQNTADGADLVAADLGGDQPTITDDGSQVGFVSRSRNLFPTQTDASTEPGDGDIVVSEVDLGVVRRVSTTPDGVTSVAGASSSPALSGTGRVVVFDTLVAPAITGVEGTGRQVAAVVRRPTLSAPTLDMGTVTVNLPGDEWFVAVKNLGPSSFVPTTATVTDGFTVTGGTCQLGLAVPPGQTCTVEVVLTPIAPGPVTGQLTVSESLPDAVSLTTSLAGAGGDPTLYPRRSGIDFEVTPVGDVTIPIAADIENVGVVGASIASVRLAGAHPDDFAITDESCTGRDLGPAATCSLSVAFRPTDAGYRTALVIVTTVTGQYTAVVVDGNGTRSAELVAVATKIRAGADLVLGGGGFGPGAVVSVSWADGRGAAVSVVANDQGSFLVVLPTTANERAGKRVVVAQSMEQVATADVTVTRRQIDNGL